MSNFLRVICTCGCENRVPAGQRSQPARCVMCGHELQIADTLVAEPDIPSSYTSLVDSLPTSTPQSSSPFEEEPVAIVSNTAHRFTTYAPPIHERMGEFCARCGNELRGEWDRLETAEGVWCYACANRAVDGVPERLKHIAAAEEAERHHPPRKRTLDVVAYTHPPWWAQYRTPAVKAAVLATVGVFYIATYVLTHLDIGLPVTATQPLQAYAPSTTDINELDLVPWALYHSWMFVSSTVTVFVAVYMSLFFNGSLPKESFVGNLLYAGAYCVPFLVCKLILILGTMAFGTDPARGPFIVVMASAAQAIAIVFIIFELLDDGVAHLMYFLGIGVCAFIAMPFLNGLVFDALSAF